MTETLGLPLVLGRYREFPVVETFGPTVQGEGPLAGTPTYFIRFGLCDYRCTWCDSMYAVEPREVKQHADYLTVRQIVARVKALPIGPRWVTLSGGNPAIHDLGDLVTALRLAHFQVAVETQGSKCPPWLRLTQMLVVSPKPPSSGMVTDRHRNETTEFLDWANKHIRQDRRALKIVVFDEDDYRWASDVIQANHQWHAYLSVGTPIPDDNPVGPILDRYRWLCEKVAADPVMRNARVLPQLHVLAWGQVRGV